MQARGRVLLGATSMLVAVCSAAFGQNVRERLEELDRKVEQQRQSIASILGIDIHGLVAVDYVQNFNDPDSRMNQVRVFDQDANTFTLNQANLFFSRAREDAALGFGINLDFGETAEVVGGATRWSNGDSSESDNSFELREAFLTYRLPIGDGIVLKAGKFVTLHGAEVIKSYNALNYTVSNSILFGFAIPFTHTGLMATIPLNDYFALDLGVVNGWDNVVDNNDGKTFHGGLKIAPSELVSLYLSGSYGPEQDDDGDSKRAMATALLTVSPVERLTFIVDGNYGNESDIETLSDDEDADWYGVAGYAIVGLTERISFTLRGEIFDDPDGVRGINATVWEVTPSLSIQISDGLLARLEYRHDEASQPIFESDDRLQSGQDTAAAELIFAF